LKGITTTSLAIIHIHCISNSFDLHSQFLEDTSDTINLNTTSTPSTKMSTTTKSKTIAFFGATGGVAGSSLAAALRSGYYCTALVRTPSKLISLLTSQHSIPQSTIDTLLTIQAGNVLDPSACAKVLISPLNPSTLVDTIFFGIGGSPRINWSLWAPFTNDDPTVCQMGMASVLRALSDLANSGISTTNDSRKPQIIAISTTGISDGERDVPWVLVPLYRWALHIPHVDKKEMERLAQSSAGQTTRGYTIVRPTLLTDGEARGLDKVRAGWEYGDRQHKDVAQEQGPECGYSIGRKDVGGWIFQRVIVEGGWEGRCVSLTW
jgi:hypothetical protein